MRVGCRLREKRGNRTLREMADTSGVLASELSRIENGRLLPADDQLAGLERAYGLSRLEIWDEATLYAVRPDDA